MSNDESETGHGSGYTVEEDPDDGFIWSAFGPAGHRDDRPGGLSGKLDEATRAKLEKLRRGE